MHKLLRSIQKECILLSRDFGGLVILFVMPLLLILTITTIQEGTFQSLKPQQKIAILLIDNDQGDVSQHVKDNLSKSGRFETVNTLDGNPVDEASARDAVFTGRYPMAVVIPEKISSDLKKKYRIT